MSKVEMIRCDGCATMFGEGGYNDKEWAEVHLPGDGIFRNRLNFCPNCWQSVKLPSMVPERQAVASKQEPFRRKSGHQV